MSAHRDAGEAAAAAAVAAAGRLPRLEGKLRWLLPLTTTKDFFKDCKVCDAHTGEAITGFRGGSKLAGWEGIRLIAFQGVQVVCSAWA
jgi:hypothetical protein